MPSPRLVPMDELEAVNEMLESIGQFPVSTLENTLIGDVTTARRFLARVTSMVQLYGFDFNTDDDYVLSPDTDGFIKVPEGILRLDLMDTSGNLKRRRHPDGFWALWDGANLRWTHEDPAVCRIVWGFPFEDMPDSARNYVALAAARKFQNKIIGATSLDGYAAEDEDKAWTLLMRDERANRDTNVFRRNAVLAGQVANRRY